MPLPDASTPEAAPVTDESSEVLSQDAAVDKPVEAGSMHDAIFGEKPEAAADESAPAEPEAPVEGKPKVDDKAEDDDLLTLPEGLKGRSQERFQKLANANRDLTAKQEEVSKERDYFKERWTAMESVVKDAGMQQEQFEGAVEYASRLNRGDFKGALEIIDAERKAIALYLGEMPDAPDPLSDYPDLHGQVENLEITRQAAHEIARGRAEKNAQSKVNEQRQAQQQEQQSTQDSRNQALTAIDTFIKDRAKTDIDFPRKEALVSAKIVEWCQGLPPNLWPAQVERMYQLIGEAAPRATLPASEPRPLRGSGMGSGAKPAPRSLHEAMWGSAKQA